MLGIFAKVVRDQPVKTRLQGALARQEAERFQIASLADTLETGLALVPSPFLFLHGDPAGAADLRSRLEAIGFDVRRWESLQLRRQQGSDLGERLEAAVAVLCASTEPTGPAFILGSDSPSLPPEFVRAGLERLGATGVRAGEARRHPAGAAASLPRAAPVDQGGGDKEPLRAVADLVLGPTRDGGYWAIGLRQPCPGLLHGVAWSSAHTLDETLERARARGLQSVLLPPWTDVDRPEDLQELALQIATLRRNGDARTARFSERFLHDLSLR